MRLVMERVAPVRRGRPVKFDMPPVASSADVVTAISWVMQAVASGELTPEEAATVASVLETCRSLKEQPSLRATLPPDQVRGTARQVDA